MTHYTYTQTLEALWDKAHAAYNSGNQDCTTYFDATDLEAMQALGLRPHEVYDFVDDFCRYDNEPDRTTFVMVQGVRRSYLQEMQGGKHSDKTITAEDLPPKTDEVGGIAWLPRLIVKANAKLRGELHEDFMYGCAGDRNFFRENDIHPAEFLSLTWYTNGDTQAIVDWVKARRAQKISS